MSAGCELVIFDCDGVLVDSEPISGRVLAEVLKERGLVLSSQEAAARFLGPRLPEVMTAIEAELGEALERDWPREFEARRITAFGEGLLPLPGVARALEDICDAGLPVCVASQGGPEITRQKLQITGLSRFFSEGSIFSAHEVGRGKPHPDLFLRAASAMGVAPGLCAVIEDAPRGVAAGLAAGMRVFEFAGEDGGPTPGGAEPLRSFEELPVLLGLS